MNLPMNIKQYDFYYELRDLSFVEGIWLYGSRAREDNTALSDIDLAILCPLATPEDRSQILQIIEDRDTPFDMDVVRFDDLGENELIRRNILKDKVVLFERKPNSYPWYAFFVDLGEALDRLHEMVNVPATETFYVMAATIQRFEFSFELFWKTLKKICVFEGYDVISPRSIRTVFEKAFDCKLIGDESVWLLMLEDRNKTSHLYRRKTASEIYYRIKSYHSAMKKTHLLIKSKYNL
jgi:nucleotidyltransferase substrate binding protein (TIGR01987 family)